MPKRTPGVIAITLMAALALGLYASGRHKAAQHKQELDAQQTVIDSLETAYDSVAVELRVLQRYIRPDSTWIAEQIKAHGYSDSVAAELTRYFIVYGLETGIPPRVLAAVARVESAFNPRAVSHADAHGILQVVPFHWWNVFRNECGEWNPYIPRRNICYGAYVLRHYLDRWGNLRDALSAYNAGYPASRSRAGRRYAERVLEIQAGD